jgi:hypothetical protein
MTSMTSMAGAGVRGLHRRNVDVGSRFLVGEENSIRLRGMLGMPSAVLLAVPSAHGRQIASTPLAVGARTREPGPGALREAGSGGCSGDGRGRAEAGRASESLKPGSIVQLPARHVRYSRNCLAAAEVTLAGERAWPVPQGSGRRLPYCPRSLAVHTIHTKPQAAVVLCPPTSVALLFIRYRIIAALSPAGHHRRRRSITLPVSATCPRPLPSRAFRFGRASRLGADFASQSTRRINRSRYLRGPASWHPLANSQTSGDRHLPRNVDSADCGLPSTCVRPWFLSR